MKAIIYGLLTMMWLALGTAQASSLTVPNTFTADTPAKAEDVNANFSAVKTSVDDNASQIAALKAQIATLQSQMSAVNNSNVMALDPYVTVQTQGGTNGAKGPIIRFSKVNVQVVNGMGSTNTMNGLGNLIIGYNEADTSGTFHCTIGTDPSTNAQVTDPTTCSTAGGTWISTGFKIGSHYLIVGAENNYSIFGGIVSGFQNTSNYIYANVTAGQGNTASGMASSVSGGTYNQAFSTGGTVSGGAHNVAAMDASSVSGGENNQANGGGSSILGGNGVTVTTVDGTSP